LCNGVPTIACNDSEAYHNVNLTVNKMKNVHVSCQRALSLVYWELVTNLHTNCANLRITFNIHDIWKKSDKIHRGWNAFANFAARILVSLTCHSLERRVLFRTPRRSHCRQHFAPHAAQWRVLLTVLQLWR